MALIRHPKDFWAGVLFASFGAAALVIAQSYPLGSAARMGPGYFPRMLGFLLLGARVDPGPALVQAPRTGGADAKPETARDRPGQRFRVRHRRDDAWASRCRRSC